MEHFHTPVLLDEVVKALRVKKGGKYIDATVGGGGHSFEIIKRGGRVLGIDVDKDALAYVESKCQMSNVKCQIGEDLILAQGNFRNIENIARLHGFERVSGILFDLGVSSYQVDIASRGLSFQKTGPLDMRMDRTLSVSAKDLIHALSKKELQELFLKLGEERNAYKIAQGIVNARRKQPIETTKDLAAIVEAAQGKRGLQSAKESARSNMRVFQALRIAVNDELRSLEAALPQALELLESGGRVAIISFHSLEDRIVKRTFADFQTKGLGKIITKKPILPSIREIGKNPRSRSAKLRIFEKN